MKRLSILTLLLFVAAFSFSQQLYVDKIYVRQDATILWNVNLSATSPTIGQIKQGGVTMFHTYSHVATTPNIFIGRGSGNFTTNGDSNGGVGDSTFTSLTATAVHPAANVALGSSSLHGLTTGTFNVAVGAFSQIATTTAGNNVAVGAWTLQSNTVGHSNIAIGYNTLGTNVGNFNSTAVGYRAMYKADSRVSGRETFNTAVGYTALAGSATSSANTGIHNTAIGAYSLVGATTGSNNVGVGDSTGMALTTGSGNVFIGHSGGSAETGSNKLYIENSNATGPTAQIYGEFDNNYVNVYNKFSVNYAGAGTSVPGYNFQVTGNANITTDLNVGDSLSVVNNATVGGGLDVTGNLTADSVFSANVGYALQVGVVAGTNLADGATYYYGGFTNLNLNETADVTRIYFPANGKITSAYVFWSAFTVAGSGEDVSFYIRINNSADALVETIGSTDASKIFNNQALDIDVVAGDYFELKLVCPTWATNPTGVRFNGSIFVSSQSP